MGQTTSSCVAGTMGWQEPYMPAKIISDMVSDEYRLNNAVPMEQQNINRRLTSLLALKCGCLDSNSSDASGHSASCQKACQQVKRRSFITKSDSFQYSTDYSWKKSLHKESYCKDVNFNSAQNDISKDIAESIKLLPLPSTEEQHCVSKGSSRNVPIKEPKYYELTRKMPSNQVYSPSSQLRTHGSTPTSLTNPNVRKTNLNNFRSVQNSEKSDTQSLLCSRTPLSELLTHYCHNCQMPKDTTVPSPTVENCKEVLILLTNHADNIATNFSAAMKATNNEDWQHVQENCRRIHGNIHTLVQNYCVKGSLKHYASLSWQKVISTSDDLMAIFNTDVSKEDLKNQIAMLGQELHNVMESLVLYELLVIVEEIIEETSNRYQAITALIELAKISDFMCCLIVKAGGIQAMVNLLLQNQSSSIYSATLRALTILCNVQPALCHLRKIGIQHVLCMLHCKYSSDVLREATALMAQLTEERDTPVTSQILENSSNIILLVKDIINRTEDDKVFLLGTVVIANLSTVHATTRSIIKHSILKVLTSACSEKTVAQLPATKEQVATILASVASSDDGNDIVEKSTIRLLLSFIQLQPLLQYGHQERAMCRRTQEKSAALLSLLCDQKAINILINGEGLHQLLSICQNKEFGNNKVLLFCTIVLQKIASSYKDRHEMYLESRKFTKSSQELCSYLSQKESFV